MSDFTMKVEAEVLLAKARNLECINGDFSIAVEKMYRIGDEMDSLWTGDDNEKLMTILAAERQRFDVLTQMLTECAEILRGDADLYKPIPSEPNDIRSILSDHKHIN